MADLTYYTLSSGRVVGLVEPTVSDVELSLRQIPSGTPGLAAMTIQRTNLVRLVLREVDDRKVGPADLRGDGIQTVFPGAQGVREVEQLRMIVDAITETSVAENAAVLSSARPTKAVPRTPDDPELEADGDLGGK